VYPAVRPDVVVCPKWVAARTRSLALVVVIDGVASVVELAVAELSGEATSSDADEASPDHSVMFQELV
jgi:hypothetical protein